MKDESTDTTGFREYFRPRRDGESLPPIPESLSLWGKRTVWGILGGAALGFTQGLQRARLGKAYPMPANVAAKPAQRLSFFVTQGIITSSARLGLFVAIYSAVDLGVRQWLRNSSSEPLAAGCVLCHWSRSTGIEQSSGLAAGSLTGFLFRLPTGVPSLALSGAAYGAGLGFLAGTLERWLHQLEFALQSRRLAAQPSTTTMADETEPDDPQEASAAANPVDVVIRDLQERMQPALSSGSTGRNEHREDARFTQVDEQAPPSDP
ncbi:hypothetical protein CCYA_CCYA17G4360 [Cyanidiococcus yangmingshanensis]|nr:hypothetical protein CCYA_CCYA17G4360 [Cyanidiococcus yangmingshanensis]